MSEPEEIAAAFRRHEQMQELQRILISKSIFQAQPYRLTLLIRRANGHTHTVRRSPAYPAHQPLFGDLLTYLCPTLSLSCAGGDSFSASVFNIPR